MLTIFCLIFRGKDEIISPKFMGIKGNIMKKNQNTAKKKGGKSKSRAGKIVLGFMIGLLSTVAVGVIFGIVYFNHMYDKMPVLPSQESWISFDDSSMESYQEILPDEAYDPALKNILLIGSDTRELGEFWGNTDTMILVTIDNINQKLKLTSFMRDIVINIPGYGEGRLNMTYALGGPDLLIGTLESTFGIKIDDFVIINFEGFASVIDAVGGIDIEMTALEIYYMSPEFFWESGYYPVDGMNYDVPGIVALQYARCRDVGDDFERTQRQRIVIQTLLDKARTMDVFRLNDLASALLPNVYTSLSRASVLELVANFGTYKNYPVEEMRVPVDGYWDNIYIVIEGWDQLCIDIDFYENKRLFKQFIYEYEPSYGSSDVP